MHHKRPPQTATSHGFTVVELLVCLTLLSVITSSLLQAAHWLERAASANGSYPLAADVPTSVLQIDGQRYKMTVTSTAKSYTLSATPLGTQAADTCGTLTINHLGVRGVQGASQTAAQCWRQ